jgi:hypothetical protein
MKKKFPSLEYSRAVTALAMSKTEAWKMRKFLEGRVIALREEAKQIEDFLVESTSEVDSWYEVIKKEETEADLMRRSNPGKPRAE